MKKQFLISLAICLSGSALAQPIGSSEPQLLIKAEQGLMAPVWSPKGDKIAVTTNGYYGILVANADGSNLKQLTDEAGAGYKMSWNAEGTQILGRTNVMDGCFVLHEVKTWDATTGSEQTIVAKTRNIAGTPTWGNLKAKKSAAQASIYETMVSDPVNATSRIAALSEFAGKMVINPALSPDASTIAFQIPGKGIYTINADGSNLKFAIKANHPAWLPDSKSFVATITTYNGEVITSSDIYAVNVATGNTTNLTTNTELIPMHPTVSPDGARVAFENVKDAAIYVINLKY